MSLQRCSQHIKYNRKFRFFNFQCEVQLIISGIYKDQLASIQASNFGDDGNPLAHKQRTTVPFILRTSGAERGFITRG